MALKAANGANSRRYCTMVFLEGFAASPSSDHGEISRKNKTERHMAPIMRDNKEIASRIADDFGANATYVEDLLRQFQHNSKSVDEEWGDYCQSLLGGDGSVKVESATGAAGAQATAEHSAPAATTPATAPQPAQPAETTTGERIPIRGPALKIVENMESSLAVPTATSARQIQIKVLDENRRWVNHHL